MRSSQWSVIKISRLITLSTCKSFDESLWLSKPYCLSFVQFGWNSNVSHKGYVDPFLSGTMCYTIFWRYGTQNMYTQNINTKIRWPYLRCSQYLMICTYALTKHYRDCAALNVYRGFLANVNSRSRSLYAIARPSVVCLSVVCLSVCL